MIYVVAVLAVLLAAAGIAGAVTIPSLVRERDAVQEKLTASGVRLLGVLADLATAKESTSRVEAALASAKTEIQKLDGELDALTTPAAVRSRLRGLFDPPAAASGAPASAGLPQVGPTRA